ncbi:MAG: C4-dicarboxylate ABC transporter [Verrucomicrobia bacterium]|nr:C4-dicarboxylate ABC transporter [Verrucomicrobiota bacterium]
METLLSPAVASLLALVVVIVFSLTSRINVGVLAVALAWPIGLGLAHWKAETLMGVFPSSLFLTLLGVTLLFGIAQKNGTLGALARRAVRGCGGVTALLPPMFFVLAGLASTLGPAAIAATALVAPLAMSVGATARVPAFLMALMVCNGANAGNLSPFSAIGVIVQTQMHKAGLFHHDWQVFAANFVAHTFVAVAAFALFGGLALIRAPRAALPTVVEPPLAGRHWLTIATLVLWIAGVVCFKMNLGLSAFTAASVLIIAGAVEDGAAVGSIPWSVIVMVCGVSVLIGVLEKTGGMDLFTTLLAKITTPASANGMMAFVTGIISTYSSTSGVVYPAFLPAVPGLVEKLGGGDPLQIALSINVGAAIVDVSPLSTIGALCIAALPLTDDPKLLFRRMLIWGFAMTVVGALFCQFFIRFFAR